MMEFSAYTLPLADGTAGQVLSTVALVYTKGKRMALVFFLG
jgi:hypothetical protein